MIKEILRLLLLPFTLLYGAIVWFRNRLYDSGFMSAVQFDIPVIAIGNLSVGGTGKTPHVEYLVQLLQYEYKLATMSRGYKRRTKGFLLANAKSNALQIGDEPMQYHLKFPELFVSVSEDRMTGIPTLLTHRPETELILLDDAYQHRSVKPGLNILITDAAQPFYKDFILPYGRLREGRGAYKRADIIIVSKCNATLSKETAELMRQNIAPLPHQSVFFSTIKYGQPYSFFDTQEKCSLKGQQILLLSGIAKPEPLLAHLNTIAAKVHLLSYPDHHYFSLRNIEEIKETIANWRNDCVIVTTEKDATRLHLHFEILKQMNVPIVVLPIQVAILFEEQAAFDNKIRSYLQQQMDDLYEVTYEVL